MQSVTHKAQGDVAKMHDEALQFLGTTKPMLRQPHRHQAFIINMDQTLYNPKDTERRTLNEKGVKTFNAKTMKMSLDRITCMLTVCADGTKIPPLDSKPSQEGLLKESLRIFLKAVCTLCRKTLGRMKGS